MAEESLFDLERLRRNWTRTDGGLGILSMRRALAVAPPALDVREEVLSQLATLRVACQTEFGTHFETLAAFLDQIEQAARQWLDGRWPEGSAPGVAVAREPDPEQAAAPEVTTTESLEQALSSLEDLLEVFMVSRE